MKQIAVLLGVLSGLAWSAPSTAAIPDPVRIDTGLLSGVPGNDASVTVFKGVPYAAPPEGELRWRAPQPAKPWPGVRKADQFGAICPSSGNANRNMSEDCLNLDLWTAAASSAERRPVMVWFHGGTAGAGDASSLMFDGEALAKKGVVVVTVNYRGGPLGNLATPELSKESGHNASGNYGLMDDIAALKWLQKNATAFGGDPNNVTLFGQSFGAATQDVLAISPLAKGLFHRMIAQSQRRERCVARHSVRSADLGHEFEGPLYRHGQAVRLCCGRAEEIWRDGRRVPQALSG
jgi:para-nitrobenzyl esterase